MKRPSVITIISVVLIVLGFFMLLTEVFMLIFNTSSSNNFILIMPAVLAAATIVSGIGLLLGKRWGWRIAAVFTAIMAGGCINTIISHFLLDANANGMINVLPIIVIIVVSLILALFNPKSTEYFGFSNEERRKTIIILCIATAGLTIFGTVRGLIVK